MYGRYIMLSVLLGTTCLISAQARTIKLQAIDCVTQGNREYCVSKDNYRALDGKIAVQQPNGDLGSICEFRKGYRNGESLFYDAQGHIMSRISFKDGIQEGVTVYNHQNGKIWISAPYTKGLLHGFVDVYNSAGKVRGKFKYDRGKLKWGYCKSGGGKVRYPNTTSRVEFNQIVTCGSK